mgnify:CR=1 FL=1
MVTITGFVPPPRDYAVFVIVRGMAGGIPLVIEKGNFAKKMWKLPGGRPAPEDNMDKNITAMREVSDEIGIIVKYPEKEILSIPKPRHNFIVLEAEYYSGELKAKAEIERVEQFNFSQIMRMIKHGEILPDHAKSLLRYIDKETPLNAEENQFLVHKL